MHYHQKLDQGDEWKQLLLTNLFLFPEFKGLNGYQRFTVQIINQHMVRVSINGYVVRSELEREICPVGQVMTLWIDREGSKLKGAIRDLVIRAR